MVHMVQARKLIINGATMPLQGGPDFPCHGTHQIDSIVCSHCLDHLSPPDLEVIILMLQIPAQLFLSPGPKDCAKGEQRKIFYPCGLMMLTSHPPPTSFPIPPFHPTQPPTNKVQRIHFKCISTKWCIQELQMRIFNTILCLDLVLGMSIAIQ